MIEDDPITYTALRAILRHGGLDVDVATSLSEGLAMLSQAADAVILDLMLPDGNGIEVLRAVRRDGLDLPVIVTTGSGEASVLSAVAALKPRALLRKPINVTELLNMLPAGRSA